jgi:DNA repair protein RadC
MLATADEQELLTALIGPLAAAQAADRPLSELLAADDGRLAALGLPTRARRRLLAAAEVARRHQPNPEASEPVTNPRLALAHLGRLRDLDQEALAVLLLDARMAFISLEMVAAGSCFRVGASPREVFGPALQKRATALILVHNHPSGEVEPSAEDEEFTAAMVDAGRLLDVDVVDHLVVARRAYFSFREAGRL